MEGPPGVGEKPGDLVLPDRETGCRRKHDAFDRDVGGPDDADGVESAKPLVAAMGKIGADLEFMSTQQVIYVAPVTLLPLGAVDLPMLLVEETAPRGLNQKLIGIGTVGSEVGVEPLIAEL